MATDRGNQFNEPDEDGQPQHAEVVPGWLQALLQKYHVQQGPLAGLQEAHFSAANATGFEGTPDDISDVLEDMAADAPKLQTGRLASSVDWGVAAESELPDESSASLADFWSNFEQPATEVSTSEPVENGETEDWLENLAPLADKAEYASPAAEPQAEGSDIFAEPDWLGELSNSSREPETPSPPQEDQPSISSRGS